MAAAVITGVTNLNLNSAAALPAGTAVDATDGAYIKWDVKDERALLVLINSDAANAATAVLKKGTGYGAAASDLSVSLAAGATKVLPIESAKWMIATGTYKGYIKVTDSAGDTKAAVVQLP